VSHAHAGARAGTGNIITATATDLLCDTSE
jgi:hypothetical protein